MEIGRGRERETVREREKERNREREREKETGRNREKERDRERERKTKRDYCPMFIFYWIHVIVISVLLHDLTFVIVFSFSVFHSFLFFVYFIIFLYDFSFILFISGKFGRKISSISTFNYPESFSVSWLHEEETVKKIRGIIQGNFFYSENEKINT